MLCKYCGIDTTISKTETKVFNDDTPTEPTEVYTVQELECINPNCAYHGKTVAESKTLIYKSESK